MWVTPQPEVQGIEQDWTITMLPLPLGVLLRGRSLSVGTRCLALEGQSSSKGSCPSCAGTAGALRLQEDCRGRTAAGGVLREEYHRG